MNLGTQRFGSKIEKVLERAYVFLAENMEDTTSIRADYGNVILLMTATLCQYQLCRTLGCYKFPVTWPERP